MKLPSKIRIVVGYIYFSLNALMLGFVGVYCMLAITRKQGGYEGFLFALVPILGMYVGSWIRQGKFGAWRISALVLSIFLGVVFVVAILFLPSLVNPDKAENKTNDNQLIMAARKNDVRKVKLALKNGAHVNARTESGQTVLHFVRDPALAKFMIDKGADVNLKENDFEMTPLYFQEVAIAQLLCKAGADINSKAQKGITPLMWHTYNNYLAGVKFLVAQGAQVNIVNGEDSTALDIALRFGYAELAEYLKSVGAKTAEELKN